MQIHLGDSRRIYDAELSISPFMLQRIDRGCVESIFVIMLGRHARLEIAAAAGLLLAGGANPSHVAEHKRLRARESFRINAESPEQFRQFVGRMRSLADERIEVSGCNAKFARDAGEFAAIEAAQFTDFPAMVEPATKSIDHIVDD